MSMSNVNAVQADPVQDSALSLEQRMAAAAEAKIDVTTEDFPVPGWSSFVWVRLKVIGHKLQRQAVEKNRRVRDRALMDLYVAADTILAATDGFYEVEAGMGPDGDEALKPVSTTWLRLGQGVYRMGEEVTPRQAFIRLIGSERVVPFYGEYIDWLNGERSRINVEQAEDFPAIP